MSKSQRSGSGSVNLQADTVNLHQGLTASEVVELVRTEIRPVFAELSDRARDIAEVRATEVAEQAVEAIARDNPQGLRAAEDPDFQYALIVAQREYARSGKDELREMLVDLLVSRSQASGNDLKRIVLTEAMETVPKLTPQQLNTLTLFWLVTSVRKLGVQDRSGLVRVLESDWGPFSADLVVPSRASMSHLVYCRCIQLGVIKSQKLAELIRDNYPGIFFNGLTDEEFADLKLTYPALEVDDMWIRCLDDRSRWQISTLGFDDFEKKLIDADLPLDDRAKIQKRLEGHLMSVDDIDDIMRSDMATWSVVAEWYQQQLKSTLTSVGTAIAHANWQRVTGATTDLSVWLS